MTARHPRHGRDRLAAIALVRRTQPLCHLCQLPVLMDVDRQRHPLRSTVDELVPIKYGGSPTDPANLRHACAVCNSSRGSKPLTPEVYARCRELSLKYRRQMAEAVTSNPRW